MKFVDNARKWYRMFSIQGLAFIGAVQSILLVLPADRAQGLVPFTLTWTWNDVGAALIVAAAAITAFGRLLDQDSTKV